MSASILSKIQKILAKAEQYDGEGNRTPEAEVAARLASKLMAEHAITEVQVDQARSVSDDIDEGEGQEIGRSTWRRILLTAIARHCACKGFWRDRKGYFYGHKSDREVAEYLFTVAERQINRDSKRYLKRIKNEQPYLTASQRRKKANSFRGSAAWSLEERLRAIQAEAEAENEKGTALVVRRLDTVLAKAQEKYNFKKKNLDTRYNHDGWRAGKNIKLNEGIQKGSSSTGGLEGGSYREALRKAAINKPGGVTRLANRVGCSNLTARKHLKRLVRDGQLATWQGNRGAVYGAKQMGG